MPGPGRYKQIKKALGPGKGPWRGAMAKNNPKGFPKSPVAINRKPNLPTGGMRPIGKQKVTGSGNMGKTWTQKFTGGYTRITRS